MVNHGQMKLEKRMQSQSLKDYASESPKRFSRPSLITLLRLLAYSALGRFLVDCWEGEQMDANGIQTRSAKVQ